MLACTRSCPRTHPPVDWRRGPSRRTIRRLAALEECRYGLRGLIVALWRAGLRVQEALALAERDRDPRERRALGAQRQRRPATRGGHGRVGLGAAAPLARCPGGAATQTVVRGIDRRTRGRAWSAAPRLRDPRGPAVTPPISCSGGVGREPELADAKAGRRRAHRPPMWFSAVVESRERADRVDRASSDDCQQGAQLADVAGRHAEVVVVEDDQVGVLARLDGS